MKTIQGYTYKLSENIGKGYSSTVHKGVKNSTGEEVSIKVIEIAKLEDPINHMLLQHQVSALKCLSFSPNVLHLYDVYATKNNTYLITELCEGDLSNLLKQKKQFPYYQAVDIIQQLINGYVDVNKMGYLHRDIKPANIFYKNGVYKLGDFGFAIPVNEISQHRNYNVGSPVYMPPEALKDNMYSISCDTWAIGIIFFQLLKGMVPWKAISEQKLHDKLMNQPLDTLTLGLPEIARKFLSEILNLDPARRLTPEQLLSWPSKLFSVEIRSLSPAPMRPTIKNQNTGPLQQIKNFSTTPNIPLPPSAQQSNHNDNNVRSNSLYYGNSQNKQYTSANIFTKVMTPNNLNLPSLHNRDLTPVSPMNLSKYSSNSNTSRNIVSSGKKFFPSTSPLKRQHAASSAAKDEQQNDYKSIFNGIMNDGVKIGGNDNSGFNKLPGTGQYTNSISNQNTFSGSKNLSLCQEKFSVQIYAECMVCYLKFVHRILKFIDPPTKIPLQDLSQSITKHLFRQFQKIEKLQQAESRQSLDIEHWSEFLSSQKGQQFNKKLKILNQKYRMFHEIENEFTIEVYKEQVVTAIQKLCNFLEMQDNFSEKSIVALDYLITFYQVLQVKEKFSYKQFLFKSKINKIMQGNPYNVKRQHLPQLMNKINMLGLSYNKQYQINNVGMGSVKSMNTISYQDNFTSGANIERILSQVNIKI